MTYFSIRPSLISSLVLVSILLATPSSASKFVDVNVLCAQTRDPSFCSRILNSKPGGAKGADLVSLAQYTIGVARAKGTDTVKLINKLISTSGSDPKAKAHYSYCSRHFNNYNGALKHINDIQVVLNKRDYYGVFKAATTVITDIYGCISGDYPDRSNLPQSANIFERVVDIILTISKFLIQK
ncbi:hypothetical protein Lal_00045655 [Lupinus albus]|uniref:Putative pectinesterase inhibitor domain-containing protein n=1 Tax=Lupinus albus TaxID=3870 RepID=A0A6A4P1R4_LUPAL|nr:putative pectinesterase inhibitor domain-containing protein [Lupinus albus]KAF1886423.1 hypothetical protein Lal_00045655 [Lupinus albus]